MRTLLQLSSLALLCALFLAPRPALAAPADWTKSGIPDWAKVPAAGKEPRFSPPKAVRFKLPNGLRVVVIERHALPLVSMVLVVPSAGHADDPAGQAGLAAFTADLMDEGAGTLDALAISARQDQLGAELSCYAAGDAAYAELSALSKTLDDAIALFTAVLSQPTFDAKEAVRVHNDRLTALKLRRDRPREIAELVLRGALYGRDTAYGHPGAGHADVFAKLTATDAQLFYQTRWDPAQMTLVVAGDVSAKTLKPKLAALGAWRAGKGTPPAKLVVAAATPPARLLVVDRPGAEQSDVRIGLLGMTRADKRHAKVEVLRTVLGDGFTSRLVQRLREQLGYTYGIGASHGARKQRGMFLISTALVTAETGKGIREINTIVDALATVAVPADELDKAKQMITRAFPQQFETNTGTADAFAELALHGLADGWFGKHLAEVRKVTAKDVQQMAREVLPRSGLTYVVVGDLKVIQPTLDQLELGPAKIYSPDGL